MKAIRVHTPGGIEALSYEDIPAPSPAPNEVVVRVEAAGVNYIDTYQRTGRYPVDPPFTLGMEGAGVVVEIGSEVTTLEVGDRVAHGTEIGAYAELQAVAADRLVRVPEALDTRTAAAVMLQGCTAHYLTASSFPLRAGHTALVHAGAGGAGRLIIQMAKKAGAKVSATVGTPAKAEVARDVGADHVINYAEEDFLPKVRDLTDGAGVDVVYDGVGQATFDRGLDCLKPRGYMVLFGAASGPVPPMDPQILNQKGSLFLTRPSLGHFLITAEEFQWRTSSVLGWVADGSLELKIHGEYALADAAQAHTDLEGRATTGKLLLIP
jgi:NADPH2:quinone reductase